MKSITNVNIYVTKWIFSLHTFIKIEGSDYVKFWAEVTRLSDIYRFTNKEEDLINVMEYMERYIGVSAKKCKA